MTTGFYIQLAGSLILAFGFFVKTRRNRLLIVLLGLLVSITGFAFDGIYMAIVLCLALLVYLITNFLKNMKHYSRISIIEVGYDDAYVKEFLQYYSKSLYLYFPIFEPDKEQKIHLLIKEMNVAGILVLKQKGDVMYVEIDFIKPEYRDFSIGNYIYNQNTGYFKKLGVNTLLAKSYHYLHSKYLLKMGFSQTLIEGELYFVKNID